ncbi:MAG: sigma factor-like helix-turn-helix DNA-binding protein [Oscillospiraceae bacterium]
MVEKERCEALAQALQALPEEDREIFYRFYDLSQTTAQIADELHMNASIGPLALAARPGGAQKNTDQGRAVL